MADEIIDSPRVPQAPRYRFLKLTNGEDLICEMEPDEEGVNYIVVKNPVKVTMVASHELSSASFGFSRWIPFTDQSFIAISKASVTAITVLNEEAVGMYLSCIETMEQERSDIDSGIVGDKPLIN